MRSRLPASATAVRNAAGIHIRGTIVGTALALALAACGSAGSDTAEPAARSNTSESASPRAGASGDKSERITPGGIAVVVSKHLGRDAVQQFATYGAEPGGVSVMITLRDGDRDGHFAVSVYSPKHAEAGKAGRCPPKHRMKRLGQSQCRTLDNGTTVTTGESPYGFSDDNANGMAVFGTATTPETGTAMAMYESYDDSPSVSAADMERILSEPRLTWLTDPALNEAGEDVHVKELTGG